MELKGKSALVTGGHRRIGLAISLALARHGCNVAVQYRSSQAEAIRAVEQIQALDVQACALQADLGNSGEVTDLAAEATQRLGPISLLVNNASTFYRTPLDQITEDDWDLFHNANLKAPFLLSLHLGRAMKEHGFGKIVNIADWSGERPYKNHLPYCVAKGGLIALTRAMAKELAPQVQVNAINPGPIIWAEGMTEADQTAVLEKTPLRRHGDPDDIANAVLFLVQATDFATGAILPIDGGRSIQ